MRSALGPGSLALVAGVATIVAFSALLVVAGLARGEEPEAATGKALLAPFKRELMAALKEGLSRGPVDAIAACRVRAPEIAGGLSKDGVRMGRSSHRLRNPANAPPDWVRPILDGYVASPSDRSPRTVRLTDDRRGYVEPISLKPLCVTCHGETIAPEVSAEIAELYPEDRAVGFQPGDLGGVFWVEFPAAE